MVDGAGNGGKKIIITESTVRRDLQLEDEEGVEFLPNSTIFEQLTLMVQRLLHVPQPSDPSENVADEAVHKELGDSLVRVATTASSLEAEQDNGNIPKTRSKATPNESGSLGTTSGGGPRCQETIGDTIARTRLENASKHSNDSLLARDEDIALVNVQDDADNEMFDVYILGSKEMFIVGQNENVVEEVVDAAQVSTAATIITITTEELTLAQALEALKTSKPKVKGVVIQELGESTTTKSLQLSLQQSQDKGKGIMVEEPMKTMKKKDLIRLDEETAKRLQAEFDEEERLAREKAKKEQEANIALIETWDDIQAKIDADHQLAERFQAQEQEELSDAEKATLFQQLLEKIDKHFAAKKQKRKGNTPPTKATTKTG
ncbi:hypothetical protein Tco_0600160 [Tanacetum coccineum]|uniref:Uncharacterized protein n=1 Tax=Tanacetum coccineum TaxID=301880 RepID=A0ABQ4WB05_9ASTR